MGFVPRPLQMTFARVLAVVVLLCGMHLSGNAQPDQPSIRSIHISGNHFFSQRDIVNLMGTRTGMQYSQKQISTDLDRIYNAYAENGFYFAGVRIDSLAITPDRAYGDLWLNINEGEQISIDTIVIAGNMTVPESVILDLLQTRIGQYLIPDLLEHDINSILREYEQHGYPFVSVGIKEITPVSVQGTTRLRLIIQVDEGRRVAIDEVKITGNTFTKSDVIIREMRLTAHEVYDERKMSKILDRLKRLNIFAHVDPPEPFVEDTRSGIVVNVREGNTSTFDGVLGYAPGATPKERGVVTGMLTVSMRNLFGTARKANIHWLRDERKSQEVAVGYTEPWVLDFPLDLGVLFHQRQQDSIYVQRKFSIIADLWLTESFTCGGTFTQEYVIPSSGVQTLPRSRATVAGVNIRYDSRDDLLSPTNGIYYYTDYQIGRKTSDDQSSTIQRISFDGAYFIQTFKAQVAAISLHGRSLYGGNIDLSDLYRFGGTNTLRGYRENQFLGSRIAWTNIEYRFILALRSFGFGFFDTGYYYRGATDVSGMPATQALKYGYGIGFRVETSLGNIGVSFGFGEGDTFAQGKVHVGLTNEF
jgi:outer membrane protein insertion porin family